MAIKNGTANNDIFSISKSNGNVEIYNPNTNASADTVSFLDVLPSDIVNATRDFSTNNLVLSYGANKLTIDLYFGEGYTINGVPADFTVNQIKFADGTIWDKTALASHLSPYQGTAAGDSMYGFSNWSETINGLDGNDYIDGKAGNDTLNGGIGVDTIWGGAGADSLSGGDGNDRLYAGDYASNDLSSNTVDGGAGDDIIFSGYGADSLSGGDGNDNLQGQKSGNSTLNGGSGDDLIFSGTGNTVLNGGDGNDNLQGQTAARSTQDGGAGSDTLYGGTGADSLNGGDGNDEVWASLNTDTSNNTLNGGAGDDSLYGSSGNDVLNGDAGKDILDGDAGNDVYYVDNLNDAIFDSAGNDTVHVSVSNYKVSDSIENVIYEQGAQALPYFVNTLYSGLHWGDIGSAQSFTYSFATTATAGLTGFSLYNAAQQTAVRNALAKYSDIAGITFTEVADSASSQLRFFRDSLAGHPNAAGYASLPTGGDVHILTGTLNGINYDDLSQGTYGFEVLIHEIGHTLGLKHPFEGVAGVSILDPNQDNTGNTVMSYTQIGANLVDTAMFDKASIHYLYGVNASNRAGNDVYHLADRYIWDGAGVDTLSAAEQMQAVNLNLTPGSWIYAGAKNSSILAANQAFIGFGTQLENAIGGSANDVIVGNDLGNTLDGGLGADTLTGGLGNDVYTVDNIGDVVTETSTLATEIDTVNSSVSFKLSANVENLTLVGNSTISATGNDQNNVLLGNNAANSLIGGLGADTMTGGLGNDAYQVDNAGDVVIETSTLATEIDTVSSAVDYTLGNNLENLTLTGTAQSGTGNALKNTLIGNGFANILTGGAGVDKLSGYLGADTLIGGAGKDTLSGGLGADIFKYNAASESGATATTRDTITDFSTVQGDKIDLSAIDANSAVAGNNAFDATLFISASTAFSGSFSKQAALYFDQINHLLYGNNDADTAADFSILLTGVASLSATDFIL